MCVGADDRGLAEPPPYSNGMIRFLLRPWRRRALLRAWAAGELEYAGALGRSREVDRAEPLPLRRAA